MSCSYSVPFISRWLPHDDVIKWKHFPRYWPFVRGIHRSPVNSPHKGQWRRALMFSLICTRINRRVNNREAGDLRRYFDHYDVTVMHASVSICNLSGSFLTQVERRQKCILMWTLLYATCTVDYYIVEYLNLNLFLALIYQLQITLSVNAPCYKLCQS